MFKFVIIFEYFQHQCEVKSQLSELKASKIPVGPSFLPMSEQPDLKSSKTKFFQLNHSASSAVRKENKIQSLN